LGAGYGAGVATFQGDTCNESLPLVVELGSDRVRVGTIRAGTSFRILSTADDWAGIELPRQDWFLLQKPARFVIPARELSGCAD
jgi:hypothetical protein